MSHPTQLRSDESALVVVDVQEKLLPKIHGGDRLVRNIAFLLEVAPLLGVPTAATEQYPKGLGPTVATLASRLPAPPPEKLVFSSCVVEPLFAEFRKNNRLRIVLVGIETHVCILNTVLDLLAQDFRVYLPIDALGSRSPTDHDVAIRRLEAAGAILTTCETVAFEWLHGADHPRFKEVSRMIQQRMKDVG